MNKSKFIPLFCLFVLAVHSPAATPDGLSPVPPGSVTLQGLLGERMRVNREGHLLQVPPDAILAGFEHRPGAKWVGEHAGKLMDAAWRDYQTSRDSRLRQRYEEIGKRLLVMQLPDGYLGTYLETNRWTSWDVWSHHYDLVGLLAWYVATGEPAALDTARRIGDLLCRTFGPQPGQRDILKSGEHMGMAATCAMEPMLALYASTGERRYLDFAIYLKDSLERSGGSHIVSSLLDHGDVHRTATAKSYEMLLNLIGLLDLYRATGDASLLQAALRAWEDIVARRLYVTGASSSGERFLDDHRLPATADAHPGEGCVTVTWARLNWHLLRLTGEARFADELERTVFNALLGAQNPRSGHVCFYPPLIGSKQYAGGLSYCCVSSISRGIAMVPSFVWGGNTEGGLTVVLYTAGELNLSVGPINSPTPMKVLSETSFPESGRIDLRLAPERATKFPVLLRVPAWTSRFTAKVRGRRYHGHSGTFLRIDREWRAGDTIVIDMEMDVRLRPGGQSYPDCLALQRGPQVLSLERGLNPGLRAFNLAALASADKPPRLRTTAPPAGWHGRQTYTLDGLVSVRGADGAMRPKETPLALTPYGDSSDGSVWLMRPDKAIRGRVSLTAFSKEISSRGGTMDGSICDEAADSYRNTENSKPELDETVMDWYAVELQRPQRISRVVFIHGKADPKRGGWFTTALGKPQIQIKPAADADWQTVATLDTYPEIAEGMPPALADFTRFEVRLAKPVEAAAIRVLGRPGKGSRTDKGRSSSCAELQAWAE
jgi:DUF1680 family protein